VRDRPWRERLLHAERWHQRSRHVRRDHRDEPALKSHARRRRITRSLVDERGSVFVTGFVLVFVMTMLGAALFDVGRLEARLRLDSQTRVQGLEIAEAGLERGLHLFFLEFVCGPRSSGPGMSPITIANCANPPTLPNPTGPNYITETCDGAGGPGCLARIALTTDCPVALLPDGATDFKLLKQDAAFTRGTYTVCVRPNPGAPTDQRRAQFRSRGVLTSVLKVKEGQVRLNDNGACIGKQESGSGCSGGATPFLQDTMSGVYSSGTWGGSQGICGAGLNGQTTTNKKCNVWTSSQGVYP